MLNYAKAFRIGNPSTQLLLTFDDSDEVATKQTIDYVAAQALLLWGRKASHVSVYRRTPQIAEHFPSVRIIGEWHDPKEDEREPSDEPSANAEATTPAPAAPPATPSDVEAFNLGIFPVATPNPVAAEFQKRRAKRAERASPEAVEASVRATRGQA